MRVTECLANEQRTPTEYELEIPMRRGGIGLARIRACDLTKLRLRYDRWRESKDYPTTKASKQRWERLARSLEKTTYNRFLYA